MTRIGFVTSAALAACLFTLTACGDERAAEAPPAGENAPATQPERSTEDTADRVGDAARTVTNEALRLAEQAREVAREAVENAGPALERAGEVAGQFRDTVDALIARAQSDLDRATRALEQRIDEAQTRNAPVVANPEAVLPAPDLLRPDTRAAARAGPAGVGPAYVGVWAADGPSCARIDREPVELFAVVTPNTIRRHESVCNIEPQPIEGGSVTLAASCIVEGDTEDRRITLTMAGDDTLRIAQGEAAAGADLVRCSLPQ